MAVKYDPILGELRESDAGAGYTLPTASAGTKGGIKVGARLTITDDVLSADDQSGGSYTLPTASDTTKGGIKIGARLTMTGEVLSADVQTTDISGKVDKNANITAGTKTKVTYDVKGLVTSGADATQDDIGDGTTYKQYSSTEKSKLSGIEAGANNYTHPATHSADIITDGTTNKAYTAVEQTKLAGIATGAEVNVNADWDAVSGDALISNKPTIPTQYTDELAQDAVGGMVADTTTIDLTYTDATPELKADIKSASVSNSLLANMAQSTIKGRKTLSTGSPEDLSASDVRTLINVADGANVGVVPNASITAGTKTKITYDVKGLVTSGTDATQDDIGDGTTYKQYSQTEKTKLAGIEAGANNYTHPATHSADIITDGTTNKAYTATEQSKLSGIATGAEVNVQSDWNQATNTEDDYIKNKPSIPTQYTDEMAQDAIGGMVNTTLTYTDGTPELKVANPVVPQTVGFTIVAGTTPKTLTVALDANVSGTNTGDNAGVTSVTGTAPVVSSGGTTPAISMAAATASVNGYATSTQITKLDGIATGATANAKASSAEINTGTDDAKFVTSAGLKGSILWNFPEGFLINGKIVPSVVSNDLILAVKGMDGNDPSATSPVYVRIGSILRAITSALSRTLADGTNWCNAGSSSFATKEIDYFAYLVWDSNSSAVGLGFSRIPYGALVSDFSATTTSETYLAGYSDFTTTDDVVNIGRFAATLSAGAGYTWTVPTFTSKNLIQRPIQDTRDLTWLPTYSAGGLMTYTSVTTNIAIYSLDGSKCFINHESKGTVGGSVDNHIKFSLPFSLGASYNAAAYVPVLATQVNTGASQLAGMSLKDSASVLGVRIFDIRNWSAGADRYIACTGVYSLI